MSCALDLAGSVGAWTLSLLVLLGALPMVATVMQYLLVALHGFRDHYAAVRDVPEDQRRVPRVAVLVPAWNEAPVLRFSVDRMMALDYPPGSLRVAVVDDASTDETPELLAAKVAQYPGRVMNLRREQGGQGKAHTLNHGLERLLDDDWAEAVLITDADVVFRPDAIRRMVRHLADENVGAVTAFIREASEPPNWMNRYIGYEYTAAQAAGRRAQNVVGAQGCLAGGAQLHTRANLVALGGRMDTTTLAEDTVTTFLTQIQGRSVIFDPNAECLAEEPADVVGLWKQRLRWSRGNIQVAAKFRSVFVRPSRRHRLWNPWFVVMWWSTLLLPAFMVLSSAALVALWFLDEVRARQAFDALWISSALGFVFTTAFTLLIDFDVAKRCWRQALGFPGLISLLIMAWVLAPAPTRWLIRSVVESVGVPWTDTTKSYLALTAYIWVSACMAAAWAVYRLDKAVGGLGIRGGFILFIVGYGPLLCAITFAAYVAQAQGKTANWDKTVKTGKIAA